MRSGILTLFLTLIMGCGDDPTLEGPVKPAPPERTEAQRPRPDLPEVPTARCPADAAPGCRGVKGRVVFRELVDPDGDGDLHVVVAAGDVTAPGLSTLDVSKDLRPRADPRIGDTVSGAGPVYPGSYGQRQIEVVEFHAERR